MTTERYPQTKEEWQNYVKSVGLQEFGSTDLAELFERQMEWESGGYNLDVMFNSGRVGSAGERGGAQWTPGFASNFPGVNPNDPYQQFPATAKAMKEKAQRYGGDWKKALAEYNAGAGGLGEALAYGEEWEKHLNPTTQKYLQETYYKRPVTTQPPQLPPGAGGYTLPEEPVTFKIPYQGYYRDVTNATADYNRAMAAFAQRGKPLEEEIKSLEGQKAKWTPPSIPFISEILSGIFPPAGLAKLGRAIFGRDPARLEIAKQEYDVVASETFRTRAKEMYIKYLPALVASGQVQSEEDALNLINAQTYTNAITEEDESWALDLFRSMASFAPTGSTAPPTADQIFDAMRTTARAKPVGVHLLTDQALIEALTQMYVPSAPFGLTWDDVGETMTDAGLDTEEVQAALKDLDPVVSQMMEDFTTLEETYRMYREGMAQPTVPKLTFLQNIRLAVTQPMLFAIELLQPYQKYLIEPLQGFLHMEVQPRIYSAFGIHRTGYFLSRGWEDKLRLETLYDQARSEGVNVWMAYGEAYRQADFHWAYRLMAESIGDPLNYIDWGLAAATKSTTLARFPTAMKYLGEANTAWLALSDIPFDVARGVGKFIPDTVVGVAARYSKMYMDNLYAAACTRVGRLDKRTITAADIGITLKESARGWLKRRPGATPSTPAEAVGSLMTKMAFVEPDEIVEMGVKLGVDDVVPTQDKILAVNKIFEHLNPLVAEGVDNGVMKVPQAAVELAVQLGADPQNPAVLHAARTLITGKLKGILNNVDRIAGLNTVKDINFAAMRFIRDLTIKNKESMVHTLRMNSRAMGRLLDGADYLAKHIWRDGIEKQLVSPMAAHYLLIANYGTMNYLETVYRSLSNRGPWHGGKYADQMVMLQVGDLTNVPESMLPRFAGEELAEGAQLRIPDATRDTLRSRQQVTFQPSKPALLERIPGLLAPAPEFITKPLDRMFQRVTGRQLRIHSALEVNQALSRMGFKVMRSWFADRIPNAMREALPREMELIDNAIVDVRKVAFDNISPKEAKHIDDMVRAVAPRGPEAVQQLKDMAANYDVDRLVHSLEDHFSKDMLTPTAVKEAIIADAYSGKLLRDIEGSMAGAKALVDTMAIQRLEIAKVMMKELTKQIREAPPTDEQGLRLFLHTVIDILDGMENLVNTTRSATQERAIQIIDYAQRSQMHDASWEYIKAFFDDMIPEAESVIQVLRDSIGKLKPKLADDYLTLVDKQWLALQNFKTARAKEAAIFTQMNPSKPRGGPANHAWWDKVTAMRQQVWNDWVELNKPIWRDIDDLSDLVDYAHLPKPKRPSGKITVEDVAYLYGSMGDDIARTIYDENLVAFIDKNKWIDRVRRRAAAVARQGGLTGADRLGFTAKNLDDVYDSIVLSLNIDPQKVSALTPQYQALEGLRQELHTLSQGYGIGADDMAKLTEALDATADNLKGLDVFQDTGKAAWTTSRQKVLDNVRTEFGRTFTNYNQYDMANAAMHSIFPYWTYESQRYPFLWRQFIRHPGHATTLARYVDYTDGGYVHIPGTNVGFSPLKGTIFMGGFRGMFLRDFPEYYDAFPGMANTLDFMGRAGFYPNVLVTGFQTLLFNTVANRRPEYSEILPASVKTPLALLVWMFPESTAVKRLRDMITPERFRNYLAMGAAIDAGHDGKAIYELILNNEKLTPEEEKIWDNAVGEASLFEALLYQGMPFRYDPESRVQYYKTIGQARYETQGVPVEMQDTISRHLAVTGRRYSDVFPLDPLTQIAINDLEGMQQWAGSSMPLQPLSYQYLQAKTDAAYRDMDKVRLQSLDGFYDDKGELVTPGQNQIDEMLKKGLRGEEGGISAAVWTSMRGDLKGKVANMIEGIKSSEKYRDVNFTMEERKEAMLKEQGIQVTYHPAKEILNIYYDLKPEWRYDWDTGAYSWDFDTYYTLTDWLLDAVPDNYKDMIIKTIQNEMTDMEKLYWTTSRKYIRPYNATRAVGLRRYTSEEQSVIRDYERAATQTERQQLQEVLHAESGDKLISHFSSELSTVRKNLRLVYPELNSWLSFWKPNMVLLTPSAQKKHDALVDQYSQ